MADEFDWDADGDCVVVPHQDAIAVYANSNGDLVLRRRQDWTEHEDAFIVISRASVPNVIEAMRRALRESIPENTNDVLPMPSKHSVDET